MVPQHLLVHEVTVIRPSERTDRYGNTVRDYDAPASATEVRAWMQQDRHREPAEDGRDLLTQRWLMVTDHLDVHAFDRVQWDAPSGRLVFEVEGPPAPMMTPRGAHHLEATLRIVEG